MVSEPNQKSKLRLKERNQSILCLMMRNQKSLLLWKIIMQVLHMD